MFLAHKSFKQKHNLIISYAVDIALLQFILDYLLEYFFYLMYVYFTVKDVVKLIPFYATIGGVCYLSYRVVKPRNVRTSLIKIFTCVILCVYIFSRLIHLSKKNLPKLLMVMTLKSWVRVPHSVGVGEALSFLCVMVLILNTTLNKRTMLDH